jgi:hypothetical protein
VARPSCTLQRDVTRHDGAVLAQQGVYVLQR